MDGKFQVFFLHQSRVGNEQKVIAYLINFKSRLHCVIMWCKRLSLVNFIRKVLTCTMASSSDRLWFGRRRCHPLMIFKVQVDNFRAVNFFLRVVGRVNVASSAKNIHAVVNHRSCVEVSIGWRRSEAVVGVKLETCIRWHDRVKSTYVCMKVHCIVSRSKQCTSHENWSITSSKPPKMYILLPTMHALWPSRAPGKFPFTSGVSHSRVRVSKQNRISQTWGKFLIAKSARRNNNCITHHLIVSTTEYVHLTFVCNSRMSYNWWFFIFFWRRRKVEEEKIETVKKLKLKVFFLSCFGPLFGLRKKV
jgi:hypothetical protein